jgi:cytoskeletal protein CcmA (bactofilin family)
MLQANSNSERAVLTERHPPGDASVGGSAHEVAAADAETSKVPVLGKTLLFRGELTAEEDVILQGRVEGSIRHARNLIIGTDGSVLGDVYARHLTVEGLVEGDLHCSEAAIVRATAQVRGNIFAPRVGIMEGATFNGRVEMDSPSGSQTGLADASRQSPKQSGASRPAVQLSGPSRSAPGAPRAQTPAGIAENQASGSLAEAVVDKPLSSQITRK